MMSPGDDLSGENVELLVVDAPNDKEMPAYERLLEEAIQGDQILFAREDTVEVAWKIIDPVLGDKTPVFEYEPNTWGPPEATRILREGHHWHDPVMKPATT